MIRPADDDDTPSGRWQRLHDQREQTDDPAELDAIDSELDEIEQELGEAYLVELKGKREAEQ